MLPDCRYRRVAAIGHWKLKDIDLSQFTSARPPNPLLMAAGFAQTNLPVPWLGRKRLQLVFG
jgi:hypothetical protein